MKSVLYERFCRKKPKRKYQKENQGWIIKRSDGTMFIGSYSHSKGDAKWYLEVSIFGKEFTWKQLYRKGYRAVKVEVTEIEEWG